MTDITKCKGELEITGARAGIVQCPHKDRCYRFTAPEDPHWQSWFSIFPGEFKTDYASDSFICEQYWPREA